MDSKIIGKFIYRLRTEKGLSQYQLAEMIPISREAVSKWERGVTIPDSTTLMALSKIFGVSINEILIGRKLTESDSKLDIQNAITLNAVDDVRKKANTIKKLKIIFIVSLLLFFNIFLLYYFINSYNSIKIFTIAGESENFKTVDGIFVMTKGKLYFRLGNIEYDDNIDIKNYELYYIDNNKEQMIFSNNSSNILIKDYYGYKAYFDIDNLNQIINNLYLRVYFNNSYEDIYLNLKKDFSNNNFLFKRDIKQGYNDNKNIKSTLAINDSNLKILNKLDCSDDVCNLEFIEDDHTITYTYIKYNHLLNIIDKNETTIIEWNYFMSENLINYKYYDKTKEMENITINLDKINEDNNNYKYIEQLKNDYIIKYLY